MDAEEDLAATLEADLAAGLPARERIRAALAEARGRGRREGVDELPVAIVELATDGTITAANAMAVELLGWRRDELVGRPAFGLLPEPDATRLRERIRARLAGDEARTLEYRVRTADGGTVWLLGRAQVLRDGDRVTGLRLVASDLTPLRRAEERARALQEQVLQARKLESLGVLAGGVAHEFNNLLVAVMGHAELALAGLDEGPLREDLERIREAAASGAELCGQLLATAGKGRLTTEPVRLSAVVAGIEGLLRVTVGARGVLQLSLDADDAVQGDPTQLRQVVVDLVRNAAEAQGDRGGVVRVEVAATEVGEADRAAIRHGEGLPLGRYVALRVTDEGVGMDPETLERAFDPFFTTRFPGRGLGLPAVQGLVHAHGGRLRVRTRPGGGSTFEVLLPSLGRVADAPAPPPPSVAFGGRALVVDDEPVVAAVARAMLERLGFEVEVASSGAEALRWFDAHGADLRLAMLDLTMPGMDGRQLLRALRQRRAGLPALLCSGYDRERSTEGLDERAAFLQKPYTLRALREAVQGALAR